MLRQADGGLADNASLPQEQLLGAGLRVEGTNIVVQNTSRTTPYPSTDQSPSVAMWFLLALPVVFAVAAAVVWKRIPARGFVGGDGVVMDRGALLSEGDIPAAQSEGVKSEASNKKSQSKKKKHKHAR